MNRISLFNLRPANPTHWELDVHTSSHAFEETLRDKPENIGMRPSGPAGGTAIVWASIPINKSIDIHPYNSSLEEYERSAVDHE